MSNRLYIFAAAVTLSACATGQTPMAPDPTQERWTRIMEQMRMDSAAASRSANPVGAEAAESRDDGLIPSIDLSKFELPIQYNERVQEYIDLYANRRRGTFAAWLKRSGRYRDYIQQRLNAHGLPKELIYLALIESGYETGATSSAAAVGLWQFMSGTARSEGLEVSDYVDERRDPFRSTDAAIRHLSGLYQTFGSWYLAAAAYNSGSGRIARLMKQSYGRVKGTDATFWQIQDYVPTETRGYVPGLIAAAIIGEHPERFGLGSVRLDPPVRFQTVIVPASTDLRAVARAAGVALEEIRVLNPQLIRGITPPDREYDVRVPLGSAGAFGEQFSRIPREDRVRGMPRTHVVRQGETLSEIAERYGTSVDDLQKANRIKRPNAIVVGRKLTIPGVLREAYGTD